MGSHLRVDLDQLASTASALSALRAEFEGASEAVDDVDDDLGHEALDDVLRDFAGNWKRDKGKLVDLLKAVEEMATQGHETYVGVDEELARELASAGRSGSGGP